MMPDSDEPILPWHDPYLKPCLAFVINSENTSKKSTITLPHERLRPESMDKDIEFISIQELFTHTINPILSLGVILPIQILLTSSSIFIQMRTLQMLKQEKSVNNQLMVTQARIHIIFWPSIVIINTLSDNIYPLMTLTTPTFCTFLSFFFYFCVFSMILYTFYAALLRYLCTVRTERVNRFGKDRLTRLIYWIFYLHTSAWSLYTILTSFNSDHIPLIYSCYGYADRVFMMENTPLKMMQRHFCGHGTDEGRQYFVCRTVRLRYKDLMN